MRKLLGNCSLVSKRARLPCQGLRSLSLSQRLFSIWFLLEYCTMFRQEGGKIPVLREKPSEMSRGTSLQA